MPNRSPMVQQADFLALFGHPKRLHLLYVLSHGPQNVGALADEVGLSQSALSQQLSKLRHAGLVKSRRSGHLIFYALAGKRVEPFLAAITEIFGEHA